MSDSFNAAKRLGTDRKQHYRHPARNTVYLRMEEGEPADPTSRKTGRKAVKILHLDRKS